MMLRPFVACFLSCIIAAPTFAADIPRAGASVEVSIVNVDVFVTDKAGNRVRGLKADDFEMFENGVRQPISNFAEYTGTETQAAVGVDTEHANEAAVAAPRQKRNLLIFFEQMHLPTFSAEKLVAGMKDLVHRTIAPGDAVSVVMWSRTETQWTDATDDITKIDAALDRIEKAAKVIQIDPATASRDEAELLRRFEQNASPNGSVSLTAPNPTDSVGTRLAMRVAMTEMKSRVAAINSALQTMYGAEGKKIMLLATRRLGEVAGAEYVLHAGAAVITHDLRQEFGTAELVKTITSNANASGVTIYPVFAPGVGFAGRDATSDAPFYPGADPAVALNETISLSEIARSTGGLTASSVTDVVKLLPQITEDVSDFYSLAYRVSTDRTDRTRKVVVKTRNPQLTVRSRREYVEKSDETQMRDRVVSALFRSQQDSPMNIEVRLGAPKKVSSGTTIPLRVRIPIGALTKLPDGGGKHAGTFSVYVASAADLDELSDVTHKTQPFQIPESDLEKANASVFTYDLELNVRENTKYVAVGVFDEVGKTYGLTRAAVTKVQ